MDLGFVCTSYNCKMCNSRDDYAMLVFLPRLGKRNEPNLMHRPNGIPIGLRRGEEAERISIVCWGA